MKPPGDSIELRDARGTVLRVSFVWREDRYGHAVALQAASGWHTLLESDEGDPDQVWPPSPAFQQLSMQGEGDQKVALLVGMAGKSHWSMSVETCGDQRSIVFDVACRVHEVPGMLGSRYQTQELSMLDADSAGGQIAGQPFVIQLDPTIQPDSQSLSLSATNLAIHSRTAAGAPPYTARWKYLVALA